MKALTSGLRSESRAAIVAFAMVALIGGSLVSLRHQNHVAQVRQAARTASAKAVEALEQQLADAIRAAQALAAEIQWRSAEGTAGFVAAAGRSGPIEGRYWVIKDRVLSLDVQTPPQVMEDLARDFAWLTGVDDVEDRGSAILGPARRAGGWIVLARAPVQPSRGARDHRQNGWAVVSMDMNEFLRPNGLGQLAEEGYDYQLLYRESEQARPGIIAGSTLPPIEEAVRTSVQLTQAAWTLNVAPRAGWPGWLDLAVYVCLVAIGALLAALLAYEHARAPRTLRVELAKSARRLRTAHRRLTEEIRQRDDVEQRASHADHHDAFTGLPNRRHFMNSLAQGLRRARREPGFRLAAIVLDFDRFTAISNLLGHSAGDELLILAARRFETRLPGLELTIARLGDDQFGIVLFDIHSPETALGVAKALQDTLTQPFELVRQLVVCTASLGIACSSPAPQRAEDLLREADLALSKAKRDGGSRCELYDPETATRAVSVMGLETDLHLALERREFRLLYQPIVCLRTARIVGMESLLRWQHPQEGLLTPDKFIDIAEQSGLVVPMTRWILSEVCRQARAWRDSLPEAADFYVGVNLGQRDLHEVGLPDYVATVLKQSRLPDATLRLEVTEGSLINNVNLARGLLTQLRALGIPLMLDDFGTGYSSLSYLQLFQFDCLKIDRSFVSRIGADGSNCGIVRAIVHMSADLGLKTVAEGVETAGVANVLCELGCDFGQGFFYSVPLDAEAMGTRLLTQWSPRSGHPIVESPNASTA